MPMNAVVQRYSIQKLLPLYRGEEAIELPINLAPSTVFPQGAVLGRIGTASANDVQTLTGTATGGSAPLTVLGRPTAPVAFNAPAAAVATALAAVVGAGNVVATGGPLGTAPVVVTFQGALAASPVEPIAVGAGLTGGTITVAHTTVGRTLDTYTLYVDGAADGSQTARCILPYRCATDGSGNITLGDTPGGGYYGETMPSIGAYFAGWFDTTQLVGLDPNAVADLGRLISGTVAAGVLAVTGA
jgi:hypothetical protein